MFIITWKRNSIGFSVRPSGCLNTVKGIRKYPTTDSAQKQVNIFKYLFPFNGYRIEKI